MEQGGTRMLKRRRGEGDGRHGQLGQQQQQPRLYLIFDDWAWGYSIREINLHPSASGNNEGTTRRRLLPRPFFQLEAPRGHPLLFAAVGTKIVATHYATRTITCCDQCTFMPIVDVRSRGVNFGPCQMGHCTPIYITVGDMLFSLDIAKFMLLSFEPLRAPRVGDFLSMSMEPRWVWHHMPRLPFQRSDITSYAVHPVEHTILVSTGEATFALDTSKISTRTVLGHDGRYGFVPVNKDTFASDNGDVVPIDASFGSEMGQDMWKRLGEWSLPFTGRAHFVHGLDAFVGLSLQSPGHCEAAAIAGGGDGPPASKLGKEKLFSEDPAETHVGATLLYMGGTEFCLVQCVSIEKEYNRKEGASTTDQDQLKDGGEKMTQSCRSYIYRLTTFSLCYDDNGELSTAETCRVQCYKVPEETTEEFLRVDPVAFWL